METGAVGEWFKEGSRLPCGESRDVPKAPVRMDRNRLSQAGQAEV